MTDSSDDPTPDHDADSSDHSTPPHDSDSTDDMPPEDEEDWSDAPTLGENPDSADDPPPEDGPPDDESASTDGMTSTDLLRYRQLIAENYAVILAVLLIIGSAGAWMGYTAFLSPSTVSEEQTVSTWSKTSEFTHGAEVTKRNPVYDVGTRLRDRQAYFPLIAPFLGGEYEFGYAASANATVDAETTLDLIIRSKDGEKTYWRSAERLSASNDSDLQAGETLRTSYRFNLNRSRTTLERIDETFGETIGDPEVVVRANTRVTGTMNGRPVDRTFTSSVVLTPDGDAFVVDDPGRVRDSFSQTRTVTSEREYSLLWQLSASALLFVGFGGALAFAWLRRIDWFALTPQEQNLLTRDRYEEWISHADLPTSLDYPDSKTVSVRSLMDLVDVAADSNNRVLYDPEQRRYAVLDDQRCYVYTERSA
jgi:hypothetical protein